MALNPHDDSANDHLPETAEAPERIWLQRGCSQCGGPAPEGTTWCTDRIEPCDVEYVRADLATPPSGDREAVLEEQRDLWKARYDLVRGLSVPDFASLFIRCVTLDKRFDDEVDKMIAARTALKHKDAKS